MHTEKTIDDTKKITLPQKKEESEDQKEIRLLKESLDQFAEMCGKTQGRLDLARAQLKKEKAHSAFVEKVSLNDKQALVNLKKDYEKLQVALKIVKEERDSARAKRKKETFKRQQSNKILAELQKKHEKLVTQNPEGPVLEDCLQIIPFLDKTDIITLGKYLANRMKELNGDDAS